jgi:hypothetical protein
MKLISHTAVMYKGIEANNKQCDVLANVKSFSLDVHLFK